MNEFTPVAIPITTPPGYHWFGYYDKRQFDPTGRYVLGMETDFEGRSPNADDTIRLGMVDLHEDNRWIELAQTSAWCWQQGCMLQWIPGSHSQIIWNDRKDDSFVSRMLDTKSGEQRTLPFPIYTISPDGRTAVTPDFRRINDMRPGYGYTGIPDPNPHQLAPEDSGIWRMDLESGDVRLIVTLADIAKIPSATGDLSQAKHYFNHLLFNTDGARFEFLHRWRFQEGATLGGFHTRMITADPDGSNLRILDDSGNTSHFIWRDPNHILAFSKPQDRDWAFYLFDDVTGEYRMGLDESNNGHCVYLPDNEWILNDTYPLGDRRMQCLYLHHVPSDRRVDLGNYPAPAEYTGEWRCDLHARYSPDGEQICFDSAHGGNGRQMYLLDINDAVISPKV